MNRKLLTTIALALSTSAFGHDGNLPPLTQEQHGQVHGVAAAMWHAWDMWDAALCPVSDATVFAHEIEDALRHLLAHDPQAKHYDVTYVSIKLTYQVWGCPRGRK